MSICFCDRCRLLCGFCLRLAHLRHLRLVYVYPCGLRFSSTSTLVVYVYALFSAKRPTTGTTCGIPEPMIVARVQRSAECYVGVPRTSNCEAIEEDEYFICNRIAGENALDT